MNKKWKKTLGAVLLAVTLCTPCTSALASSEVYYVSISDEISTRGSVYKWAYKFIDGKLYKRLYDITSGKYVGEWILVE